MFHLFPGVFSIQARRTLDLPVVQLKFAVAEGRRCVLVKFFDLPVELYEFVEAEGRQNVVAVGMSSLTKFVRP